MSVSFHCVALEVFVSPIHDQQYFTKYFKMFWRGMIDVSECVQGTGYRVHSFL